MARPHHTTDSSSGAATGPIPFPSTHWSSILAAKDGDWAAVQDSLGKLCARYRPAMLSYFRLKWRSYQPWAQVQDAEDLTQSFIAHLLEAQRLRALDPRKVRRFRHYLISALRNFLRDWVAAQQTQKRGEGRQPLPLLQPGVPEGIDVPADDPDLASTFSRNLAVAVHRHVIERLQQEMDDPARFDRLRRFLFLQAGPGDYASAAADLGISQDAVKASVSRWLRRYAELLLLEFSPLVANGSEDLQGEVKDMLKALNEAAEAGELDL